MVFGLFSKERALKRAIDKANNKFSQSPDRWAAMEKLRDEGSEEALLGLCRRFSFNYDKMMEDEQEKDWVVDALIAKGEVAVGPLRRYMKSASTVAHALKVLEHVAPRARVLESVDEMLADEQVGYTRDPTRRIQVIHFLGEWKDVKPAELAARVAPYLADHDEEVRFAAAEALAAHPSPEATEPLVTALLREGEESKRFRRRALEVLAAAGQSVGSRKDEVEPLLPDLMPGHHINKDGIIKKSGK